MERVLIVGMGRSGQAAARLALAQGARVVCTDLRADATRVEGTAAVYGEHRRQDFVSADRVVVSPGVPAAQPDLRAAAEAGIEVVGELGYAWQALGGLQTVAVTGTNGKSSTTWFTGQLLEQAGRRPFVGGNIGRPLSLLALEQVRGERPADIAVVEVSSYQLELPGGLHPQVGSILNLTPDHLGRHGDMAGYAAAKLRLFAEMGPEDIAILPPAMDLLSAPSEGPRVRWLGRLPGVQDLGDALLFGGTPDDGPVSTEALGLLGAHNRVNVAAACLMCLSVGVRRAQLDLGALQALPHRLETVSEVGGVRWINDSKATNVDAALAGITGVPGPRVVLLGGQGKDGADYGPLNEALADCQRPVLCFGASGPAIAAALDPSLGVELLPGMAAAVERARALARPGDSVLLSPACASFDEFDDFEHRGRVFGTLAAGGEAP